MRTVIPNLLVLGNARDARDLKSLSDCGIRAVVDLALNEPPAELFHETIYLRIPLIDGAGNSPELIRLAVVTVEHLIRGRVLTLVACSNGMGRSPAVVAFALARWHGRSPKSCVPEGPCDISEGFWTDLSSAASA